MYDGSNPIGISEFADKTLVNPIGLTLLLLLVLAMLCVPRRHTLLVLLAGMSFMAIGQRLVILSLDFGFLRILVLAGWVRILLRGETLKFYWNRLDAYILAWNVATFILYLVTHGLQTFVFKLGNTFDSVLVYFLLRYLIRDFEDVKSLINASAITAIVVSFFFFYEFTTRSNVFSVFGGVPAITVIREGKLRCQGAYAHPILAGCFWAILAPLMASRALQRGPGRLLSILGLLSATLIVALSNSSTPIVGMMTACIGFMFFPLRRSMRQVRWAIVIFLILMQSTMIAPIYTLIGRITLSQGSTGYHRVAIIEASIKYLNEWIWVGTANINHWRIFRNDITNKYVVEGINGGCIGLGLFIMLIVTGFSNVGKLWRAAASSSGDLLIAWSIGVSLCVHLMNFIGVFYFGQIETLWNLSLVLTTISPIAMSQRGRRVVRAPTILRVDATRQLLPSRQDVRNRQRS